MSKYRVYSGLYVAVFELNTGKYGPNKTPYLDTFHAMHLFIQIEQAIENNIDIAIIRDLKQYFGKIESELFNLRFTKFVKVAKDPDIRLLREKMRVANCLSNELNNLYLSYAK